MRRHERHEGFAPVRMRRVAIVAPEKALREVLVQVAEAGCVDIDLNEEAPPGPAARALRNLPDRGRAGAELAAERPDPGTLARERSMALLAGEAQVEDRAATAVRRGDLAALAGWCPADEVAGLSARLAAAGGSVVPLKAPRGVSPPTRLRDTGPVHRAFTPLVSTYGTVPYADLDPTWAVGVAYVVMFGVMFGDAGHGALLLLAALLIRFRRPRRLARLRPLWPFVAAAGLTATAAGVAYGEVFGPTGVLPALWLVPLDRPGRLLAAAVGLGALLIGLSYVAGAVNRRRESGPATALYAVSGGAGLMLWSGLLLAAGGLYLHLPALSVFGLVLAVAGLVLIGAGAYAVGDRGPGGVAQTGVQLFDAVVRVFANTISFARLAAFGLTHAALGQVVWHGTTALWGRGAGAAVAAVAVFVVGNVLTFALEALTAGVQALRLEYYELFSRLFVTLGRPFRPWALPVRQPEVKR